MPALPWVEVHPIDPNEQYIAMASRPPLWSYRSVPGFLRDALKIRRQLAQTPGRVGHALNAQLARTTFWTFSVWVDQTSVDAFAASDPHHRIIRAPQPRMEKTSFESFQITGSSLPMTWEQMKAFVNPLPDQKDQP